MYIFLNKKIIITILFGKYIGASLFYVVDCFKQITNSLIKFNELVNNAEIKY